MKTFSFFFSLFLFVGITAFAQEVEEEVETPEEVAEVITYVEKMAEYPGGEEAMFKFIQNNLEYPEDAKEKGIKGTVYARFVINKDGSISDIQILRGIHKSCDEACIRVLNKMPNWIPAQQKGKNVKVMFTMPFSFKLK